MPKVKTKTKERTSLMLSKDDYNLLDEVRDANGWSVGEATRRAVHVLFAFDARLKSMAEHYENQGEAELAHLLKQLRRVDPALLVQLKPMEKVEAEEGFGIRIGELTFYESDSELLAGREVGGQTEIYEVLEDGRLGLRYPSGPEFVLNLN